MISFVRSIEPGITSPVLTLCTSFFSILCAGIGTKDQSGDPNFIGHIIFLYNCLSAS